MTNVLFNHATQQSWSPFVKGECSVAYFGQRWHIILWYRPYEGKHHRFCAPRFIWLPHCRAFNAGRLFISYDVRKP